MAVTAAAVSAPGLGRLPAPCSGVAIRREGGMSFLASISSAVGVPFGARRVTSGERAASYPYPQEFMVSHHRRGTTAALGSIAAVASVVQGEGEKDQAMPLPSVHIDQHTDPESTIVEISFGDRLGALLDTTKALKNLGLNVRKAQVITTESSQAQNKFFITRMDNGNKVENPELLEAIRLTIINNLIKYHPESGEQLYLGEIFGTTHPKQRLDVDVATHITLSKVSPKQSLLVVETADRPGLLLDIISVITDISVMVESADVNTDGLVAIDRFYVSYGGAALSKSLEEVLVNCLRYHIRKAESEDESY